MSARRTGWRAAAVVPLSCLLSIALLSTASAKPPAGDGIGSSGDRTESSQSPSTTPSGSGTVTTPTRSCAYAHSSTFFGVLCASGTSGVTLAELLSGQTLPNCWLDDLPVGYPIGPSRPDTDGKVQALRTCLLGVDRRTGLIDGTLRVTQDVGFYAPGDPHEWFRDLTPQVQTVLRALLGNRQIPFPLLDQSPSSPRVGQRVVFSLLEQDVPDVVVGDLRMFAEPVALEVDPGDGSPLVRCSGGGRAVSVRELDRLPETNADGVCDHVYERSSNEVGSGEFADRYPVTATAYWRISYQITGQDPVVLGTHPKTVINQIRVPEVHTLNVS